MLENLKRLRLAEKISQSKLGNAIGVSQQSINKYENHNIEPDISTLIKIADYFNTSVDYLIGHTDVNRVIEKVEPYDLNPEEIEVIQKYRKLSKEQKRMIKTIFEICNGENK